MLWAPVLLGGVLGGSVLGVVDNEVGTAHELGVAAVVGVEDRLDAARLFAGEPEGVGEGLVVGEVADGDAIGLDAVAETDGGMVKVLGRDADAVDLLLTLGEVAIADLAG